MMTTAVPLSRDVARLMRREACSSVLFKCRARWCMVGGGLPVNALASPAREDEEPTPRTEAMRGSWLGRTGEEHPDKRCVPHPSVAVGQPSCWEADLTWRGAGGRVRDLPACHEERAGEMGRVERAVRLSHSYSHILCTKHVQSMY